MNVSIEIKSDTHNYRVKKLRTYLHKFKEAPGVYVFYDINNTVLYVGKSKNLQRRLRQHLSGSNVNLSDAYYCTIHVTNSENSADILETYLINELEPAYNIDKAVFKSFSEYASESLQEVLMQIKELQLEIEELTEELREYAPNVYEDDDFEVLGEHLWITEHIRQIRTNIARLKRRASVYLRRGGKSLNDTTVEEMKILERRRRSSAYLAIRGGVRH